MTPPIGDNSEKAAKDRRVLFAYYHRRDRDIAAKIRELNEEKKSNRQNAKASGFAAAKLDHYLKAFLAEDQQKPVDKLRSEHENLEWLGLIPERNKSGDLFEQGDRVDQEQLIQAKGFHAGLNGLDRVSNYAGGSTEDRLWLDSYDAGKREFDIELPDIMARIEAAASKETPPVEHGDDPFENAGATIN